MPLKQKFSAVTFIGRKFMAFLKGPCQQGRSIKTPVGFSAVQMNRFRRWARIPVPQYHLWGFGGRGSK